MNQFPGFPADAVCFLQELKANNNREWFQANKQRYEHAAKLPAERFITALAEQLSLSTGIEQRGKLFRIHRDLRFSADKTPYKTWLHFAFRPVDEGGPVAGWFFALEPDGLRFGTGSFIFDKPGLQRFRERLDSEQGLELNRRVEAMLADGVRLGGPDLKRVPRGYPADHPCAELLRYKAISAWLGSSDVSPALDDGCIDHCITQFNRLKPLYDWLIDRA